MGGTASGSLESTSDEERTSGESSASLADSDQSVVAFAFRSLWSRWTIAIGLAGIVMRVMILASPAGALLADEAYTGLASMGVLDGRFPVILDGNRYTAVFEAYLFAPVTAVIGADIVALKLVPIVFWATASALVHVAAVSLTMTIRSASSSDAVRVGSLAGSFAWLTPGALLVVSTLAYPSYALGMATCTAGLIVATVLIDRTEPDVRTSAALGAIAGLGVYMHPMFLAVLLPISVPVAWVHRSSVRGFWLPFVAAGVAANLPFLIWNVRNGFASLDVQNALPGSYTDRLRVFATELVPRGYGLRDESFDWVLGTWTGLLAYGLLIAAVVAGCVRVVRGSRRPSRWLLPLVLVSVWPLMALFSPLIFSTDGRYAILAFPFVAIACSLCVVGMFRHMRSAWVVPVAIASWMLVLVVPHTRAVVVEERADVNAAIERSVGVLTDAGIERIAGSYWRVLPIEYVSDREIRGAVIAPFPVRTPDSQRIVEATPPEAVAFVFPTWADDPSALWLPVESYERIVVGDTVVYLPTPSS